MDPYPVWTWWYLVYMLSSVTFPLNVRIIWSDPFSDGSSFYIACVCSHCRWKNQNHLAMSLTSPVSSVSDIFFLIVFLFILFTGIGIIWHIRFVRWWIWQWWVWLRVSWYLWFSFLIWWICWSCRQIRWSCQWYGVWSFCPVRNWVNWWRCSVGNFCTKMIRVQMWLTHRNILPLKILIPPPSFKIIFGTIVLFWPRPVHSNRCSVTKNMTRRAPVVSIRRTSNSGSRDAEGPISSNVWTAGSPKSMKFGILVPTELRMKFTWQRK